MPEETIPKKRGRPPLPPEERIRHQKEHNKNASKKYRESHPYSEMYYEIKIRTPKKNKVIVSEIIKQSGLSASQLFASLIQEKYGIDILK